MQKKSKKAPCLPWHRTPGPVCGEGELIYGCKSSHDMGHCR
jgi:hypothetical protein